MKYLAIAALLLTSAAYAEDATKAPEATVTVPTSAAPTITPPSEYYVVLTQEDLNIIAAGINELQKKVADPFLYRIDNQLKHQSDVIAKIKAGK